MPNPMHKHNDDTIQDDGSLLKLASQIDDGQPVDWETAEARARDEKERAVLAELRVLAALSRVCRDPDEGADGDAARTQPERRSEPRPAPVKWRSLTILEPVGRGGFASVYRARDPLNREVALKLFPVPPKQSSVLAKRVLREGSLLAKVRHPNVVVVHGVERANDHVGLWMEFINGRTMEDELKTRGPLSADEATPIGVDLCRALAAVHACGLLHRDVKAQNVMREAGGRTVLMDFGAGSEEVVDPSGRIDVAGTPLYLAPEHFARQPATRASDIYSLGVLLFRMVTGRYPVEGANRVEIGIAHNEQRRNRLRDIRPDLPPAFVQTIERALAPDPKNRFQTAAALESALMGGPTPVPVPAIWQTWWGRSAAAAAAVLLVAVPAWFEFGPESPAPPQAGTAPTVPVGTPAATPAPGTYTVTARFYRREDGGREIPLLPGDQVAPGQALALRFESSTSLYLYLVTIDDKGEQYLLFPPGGEGKPLEPSRAHWLPGPLESVNNSWEISTAGGREHFLLMASRERLVAFEPLIKMLPSPQPGRAVAPPRIPESVINELGQLRGIGRLVTSQAPARTQAVSRLFDGVEQLRGDAETATDLWARQVTFENPVRR